MQSHYEINISKDGRHLFATAERSCVDDQAMRKVLRELCNRFPASDGYSVTCTYWECRGIPINILEQTEGFSNGH